jgi:alpha/beta superfamily hydrolase
MPEKTDWQHLRESSFLIDGPAGKLELLCNGVSDTARGLALICHPHPLFAGTLSNKVVFTLARVLRDSGFIAVRFNFRGVGASEGTHDDGVGEIEDARAVLAWIKEHNPTLPVVLGGFSFGAAIATKLAQTDPCKLLVLIAPPVPRWGTHTVHQLPCSTCIVQADDDELVDVQLAKQWFNALQAPRKKIVEFAEGGHFFHSSLPALRSSVETCINELLD